MSRSGWHNRNAKQSRSDLNADYPGDTPAPKPETPAGQCDFCAHPLADHGTNCCGVPLDTKGYHFCTCPRRNIR